MKIPELELVTTRTDAQARVKVVGELDLETAARLGELLVDLAGQGASHVSLDLSAMAFIDSTSLSVLISGLKHLREAGGDLALQFPRPSAMKVFELTGLTSVFVISNEPPAATASGIGAVMGGALTAA